MLVLLCQLFFKILCSFVGKSRALLVGSMHWVLFLAFCFCVKHYDWKQLGTGIHYEEKPENELKAETWRQNWSKGHRGTLHIGLFPMVCSYYFLILPEAPYLPRDGASHMVSSGQAILDSIRKKGGQMLHKFVCRHLEGSNLTSNNFFPRQL